MVFAKGDYVKVKGDNPEYGVVISQTDDQVKWRTAWREERTNAEGELEAATGLWAMEGAFQPDIMELLMNVGVFGAGNALLGRKLFSKELMKFALTDAIYELLGKTYLRPYEEMIVTVTPLSGEDRKSFFSQQDVMNAVGKSLSISILDLAWRLVTKKGFGMGSLWYGLKVAGALTVSNVGSRLLEKNNDGAYTPQ